MADMEKCKFCDIPVYVKSKTDEDEYLELPINYCPMCGREKE